MFVSQASMERVLLERLLNDKRNELAAYDRQLQARSNSQRRAVIELCTAGHPMR